jgi:hypothetical protein
LRAKTRLRKFKEFTDRKQRQALMAGHAVIETWTNRLG